MNYLTFLFFSVFCFTSFSQTDLLGKYKLAEANGVNYEGFALFDKGEAVFLKVYSKRFLYDNELPKDSLSLFFNPKLAEVSTFPIDLQLAQAIKGRWELLNDTLVLYENKLTVKFRKYKTSWAVAESQISGFISTEPMLYYKFQGYNQAKELNSSLNIMSLNKDQIPSNFDLFEYFTDIPKTVLIKTSEGMLIDSLAFENGIGSKEIIVKSKANRGKDNLFCNYQLNKKRQAGYFFNEIHGYEYTFYHPKEITETYVGKNFLLKCEAWYEQGVKHGKWLYYDKVGNLTKTEVWKKGKLVKSF